MLVVLYTIIAISLIGLLSYYLIFISLNRIDNASQNQGQIDGISLIICAKNEEENLKQFLPYFFEQDYRHYEIIVVNDCSTDGTSAVLNKFAKTTPHLRIIHLEKKDKLLKGKRQALWAGVQAAKYDYVALTDADCKPSSASYLSIIAGAFSAEKEIVLGFSPYKKETGFLNKLIQYETVLTALLYLSFAKIGKPFMGVGRNIAYKKSLLSKPIFEVSNKTQSGDDDLIFAEVAKATNVTVCLNEKSFLESKTPKTTKAWYYQKLRHYSTAGHYSITNMLKPGLFNLLNILFYCSFFALFFCDAPYYLIITLYLLKINSFIGINIQVLKKLGFNRFFSLLFIDLIYFLVLLILHTKTLFSKSQWQKATI